ncbi:MAG: hypothetical protein ABI374_07300 [Ginsengibacter sp.]
MKRLFFLVIALAILSSLLPSCNKNPDNPTPPIVDSATIMGFKDSTQLVKSYLIQYYDGAGNMDTLNPPVYLYYDTINKKIYFSAQPVTSPPTSNFVEFNYNSAGLIIKVKSNLPPDGLSSIYYTYDGENVIKSVVTQYSDGTSDAVNLTKINLPSGGYSLSFTTIESEEPITLYLDDLNFDSNGRLVSKSDLLLPGLNDGTVDSVIYDASGNVSKVIETYLQGSNGKNTYNLFEFTSRDTKGDQLSNFDKILFNGVANFPSGPDINSGNLFTGYDNYYLYQFTKYPSLSTKVYDYSTGLYRTFDNSPQYDSKGRLIKYKIYNGDVDFNYAAEYDLTYYK